MTRIRIGIALMIALVFFNCNVFGMENDPRDDQFRVRTQWRTLEQIEDLEKSAKNFLSNTGSVGINKFSQNGWKVDEEKQISWGWRTDEKYESRPSCIFKIPIISAAGISSHSLVKSEMHSNAYTWATPDDITGINFLLTQEKLKEYVRKAEKIINNPKNEPVLGYDLPKYKISSKQVDADTGTVDSNKVTFGIRAGYKTNLLIFGIGLIPPEGYKNGDRAIVGSGLGFQFDLEKDQLDTVSYYDYDEKSDVIAGPKKWANLDPTDP